jgi:hypothetical protein
MPKIQYSWDNLMEVIFKKQHAKYDQLQYKFITFDPKTKQQN